MCGLESVESVLYIMGDYYFICNIFFLTFLDIQQHKELSSQVFANGSSARRKQGVYYFQ